MRGEAIEHGIPVRRFCQQDPVNRLTASAPPGLVGHQVGGAVSLGKKIRTGTDGGSILMGSAFDNGDIQQGRQARIGTVQRNGDCVSGSRDGGGAGKPLTVALRGSGPVQRGLHVGGSQRGAIGEGDAGAQGEGINRAGCVGRIAFTKTGFRLQLRVQAEHSLVKQGTDGLLHTVRTGDGIQSLPGSVGKGKYLRYNGVFLFRFCLLFKRLHGREALRFREILLPAAAEHQKTKTQQQGGQSTFFHGRCSSGSGRAAMAI